MDEEGFLYITGRASDMYISGGSNIYPREIEEKILTHPAIAEVAVLGVPDRTWGEVGVAVCALRPEAALDERELLAWLDEQDRPLQAAEAACSSGMPCRNRPMARSRRRRSGRSWRREDACLSNGPSSRPPE